MADKGRVAAGALVSCPAMPRALPPLLLLLLAGAAAGQNQSISVVYKQLMFEEPYELVVNASVEYILPFVPSPNQALWPIRVKVSTSDGDVARPLLITARRRIGATTWQLPYRTEDSELFSLERTLCPDAAAQPGALLGDCDDESYGQKGFSLHIGSSCASSATVHVFASFARDFHMSLDSPTVVNIVQGAPQVSQFSWLPGQRSVRLVASADDDVCATVAVQNYTVTP